MKELQLIQSVLKAPKGQYNSFGRYKYRSCEDIVEAVKPLLKTYECCLTMSDELVLVGDRYYIKATITLLNKEGKQITTTGWAREEAEKKGMDGSQITGSSSSYARKYALNGLFAIDDGVDADSTNTGEVKTEDAEDDKEWITKEQIMGMKDKTNRICGFNSAEEFVKAARAKYKVSKENAQILETLYKVTTEQHGDGESATVNS